MRLKITDGIHSMPESPEVLDGLYEAVLNGRAEDAVRLTNEGLELGHEPLVLLYDAMIPGLEEVGRLFEEGQFFLPEMLVAGRAMQAAMDVLRPLLVAAGGATVGTFVMGTVAGDIHDVGKNMCNVMLEGAGFEVIDLGINVPGPDFVEAIRDVRPDVLGMSAFLTTTMGEIEHNMVLIEEAGLRGAVKIMIGGAPITDQFAKQVGADGYAPDASSAARMAKRLLD